MLFLNDISVPVRRDAFLCFGQNSCLRKAANWRSISTLANYHIITLTITAFLTAINSCE
jgi:hypothetical protein